MQINWQQNIKLMTKDKLSITLVLAGIYNIIWGAYIILLPKHQFEVLKTPAPEPIEIWQCVGMIVGVYGLGYLVASTNYKKHWPIVLVGLLGKIFGPIGFAKALYEGIFPPSFGINIIFNDLIWWIPFSLMLKNTFLSDLSSRIKTFSKEDMEKMEQRFRANFINSLSGFKSSNLIGTINDLSPKGKTNLSIISSAFHLGAHPPLLGFINRPDTVPRHTLDNIRATGYCTLNHVNQDIFEKAHQTSARYPKEVSEFSACGLTEEYLSEIKVPYVKEGQVKLLLKLENEIKIEQNGTHLLIMSIVEAHLPENIILPHGGVDIEKAGSICVSGLDNYHSTDHISRLSYAKPEKPVEWL